MEFAISTVWLLLKCAFVGFYNDQWLYWLHRFFHADTKDIWKGFRKIHKYLRACHMVHHRGKYSLKIHPVEWFLALVPPCSLAVPIIGWKLMVFFTVWGVFEAARGHGHFLKIKWLPKKFYTVIGYAEVRYHVWHHRHEKENLGQFLWYNDYIFGTMAKRYKKQYDRMIFKKVE